MKQKSTRRGALNLWLSAFILLMSIFTTNAQKTKEVIRCYSTEYDSIRHAQNPDLQSNEEFEAWMQKLILEEKSKESKLIINGVYQIPIIVHVVHNGEAIGTGRNVSAAVIQTFAL